MISGDSSSDTDGDDGDGTRPCVGVCYARKLEREARERAQVEEEAQIQYDQAAQDTVGEQAGGQIDQEANTSTEEETHAETTGEEQERNRRPCVGVCYVLRLQEQARQRQKRNWPPNNDYYWYDYKQG